MSSIVVAANPLLVKVSFAAASNCVMRASGAGSSMAGLARSEDGAVRLRLLDSLAMGSSDLSCFTTA
ncbi:hypothetical protein ACYCVF_12605 [Bradyrhizobium sp. 1.29L]